LGDPRRVTAAIGADALMNIVGEDREALHQKEQLANFGES
jgi:hypothetical protein